MFPIKQNPLLFLLLFCVQIVITVPGVKADPLTPNPELKLLAKKYSIEISVISPVFPDPAVTGKEASQKALDAFVPIFLAEWNLYPVSLVRKSGLKRIILCEDLMSGPQKHGAVPDWQYHDLYYDVGPATYAKKWACESIHHEFFHMLDCTMAAPYGRQIRFDTYWSSLNPPDFYYGGGGIYHLSDPHEGEDNSSLVGFLNTYSQSAVEEDKAEIYAHMMMDRVSIEKCAEKDHYIAGKIQRIEAVLLEFCPDMNRSFWHTARILPRPYLE